METGYVLGVFAAMAIVTFALRGLPFLTAQWLRHNPLVRHLGRFLPLAIMTLLVLHSVIGLSGQHTAPPWPEGVAVALTVLAQWKTKNPLLSIATGTLIYVLIRNYVLG
ncbi:branched-chain amino acid transporter permease [Pollutimonas harenae]|uniref:AzlD domain-containing protein n=1 Tax=Pollutimonas harenae TaxID=657015 RepID=A0A853GQ28_9BURK|nr:AzlD domain-containing protein [Pollutimonas harenae]NYT85148.1 AzlD domain-containing protein [Pollutimonas harenae]TEA72470.1 AzlD domain-containing protein [Pollutimonas harenae]